MKKYIFFILTMSTAIAFADEIAPANDYPALVKLTPEEQKLVQRVIGITRGESVFKNDYNRGLLARGCGIYMTWQWQKQSYHRGEYPYCSEVLEFLKKYAEQVDNLNAESKKLLTKMSYRQEE
jgi:hypothetical protein